MDTPGANCPFEETVRAARCSTCCRATPLPPCVTSWLQARTRVAQVTVLRAERAVPQAA